MRQAANKSFSFKVSVSIRHQWAVAEDLQIERFFRKKFYLKYDNQI